MRLLPFSGLAVLAIALVGAPRAEALSTVCTAAWTSPDGIAGGTKSAPIQGANPACPTSAITATVTVGTGLNAGQVVSSGASWNTDAMSSSYPTTSDSGIAIGSLASSTTNLSLTFDRPVESPYFYTSYFNAGESLTFSAPFAILQSSGVTTSGSTIYGSGSDSIRQAGFVARFIGSYSAINFSYSNANTIATSFGFTTGVTPVPGPLPILGVGAALGQVRRLRRLSQRRL